jgi:hypothetical protein
MAQSTEAPAIQAKVLRVLADRLEHGGRALPRELERALVRELEDRADLEEARARSGEPTTTWEQVKAELGL